MVMPAVLPRYTVEEYLAIERAAEFKSEFIDGHICAMSGGSPNHSRLKVDLTEIVNAQLHGSRCEAFDSDMRVLVDAGLQTYPDLSVVCGASRFGYPQRDVLLNPTVMFEVLSPSTEAYDRGEKFNRCQGMPSLRQYVLINQSTPRIEVFTRDQEGVWSFGRAEGLDATLRLESIGCELPLRDVYARVRFDGGAAPGV